MAPTHPSLDLFARMLLGAAAATVLVLATPASALLGIETSVNIGPIRSEDRLDAEPTLADPGSAVQAACAPSNALAPVPCPTALAPNGSSALEAEAARDDATPDDGFTAFGARLWIRIRSLF